MLLQATESQTLEQEGEGPRQGGQEPTTLAASPVSSEAGEAPGAVVAGQLPAFGCAWPKCLAYARVDRVSRSSGHPDLCSGAHADDSSSLQQVPLCALANLCHSTRFTLTVFPPVCCGSAMH